MRRRRGRRGPQDEDGPPPQQELTHDLAPRISDRLDITDLGRGPNYGDVAMLLPTYQDSCTHLYVSIIRQPLGLPDYRIDLSRRRTGRVDPGRDGGSLEDGVGAGNPVTSRDLHVLVEEAAEPVSSEHVDRWPGGSRAVVHGRALMQ